MRPQNDAQAMPYLSGIKLALTTRKIRSEVAGVDYLTSEPVAIVGMACRFPGGATSPDRFWDLLEEGFDAIREVPPERWRVDAYFDADPASPGKINTRWGGFLDNIDLFDADFFGIAPREAARMDPQQRLLLEVTYEALDDAGYPPPRLAGSLTGVYLASYNSDYAHMLYNDIRGIDAHTSSGTAHSISSGRIAYLLDLKGPCLTVDTACSSSLVAVHLAVQALRQGGCRIAVAGGVSLVLSPEQTISLSKWGMLAPDGRCKTFDAGANGFVRGEGCGMVVLKRLSDAVEDNDRILAIIRGTAVNHDGRSNALTAPNGRSQEAVIRQALQNACIEPERISYIEAHGTGTALGDPIEVEALGNVFGGPRSTGERCLLGSVKTNIGHLEAAAGIAGLIKVVLSLQHGKIPPHVHFKQLNHMISLSKSCLVIEPDGSPWPAGPSVRFAGISAFGFGGTNAHVVIEEPPRMPVTPFETSRPYLLPISARTAHGLRQAARRFQTYLEDGADQHRLEDICYTAAVLRTHHSRRLAVSAYTAEQMAAKLASYLDTGLTFEPEPDRRRRPRVGFIFSGQGSHWQGMGRELIQHDELFAERFAQCDAWVQRHAGWSPIEMISDAHRWSLMQKTEYLQPVLFAIQMALVDRLQAWGLVPDAVVGHSVGEVAAACVGRAFPWDQALELVVNRARLMQQASGQGMMASVALPVEQAQELLGPHGSRICIAAVNAPTAVTLSGEAGALSALLEKIDPEQHIHRKLPVDCAFHSAHMAPFQAELVKQLGSLEPTNGKISFYSTVTGGKIESRLLNAVYWGRNLREPVAFAAAIQAMAADGCEVFVEIGPHPILLPFVAQILETDKRHATLVPTLRRRRPERESLLDAVARLYKQGCEVDWKVMTGEKRNCVSLPAYPWQRERYWVHTAPKTDPHTSDWENQPARHPLLGERLRSPLVEGMAFQSVVGPTEPAFLNDHRLLDRCVVPATAMLDMAIASALIGVWAGELKPSASGAAALPMTISDFSIHDALALPDSGRRELHSGLAVRGKADATFRLFSSPVGSDQWTLHAQGSIRCGTDAGRNTGDSLWPVSLATVRTKCTTEGDVEGHYADFKKRGLLFGPAFRRISALFRNDDTVVVRVEPPDTDTDNDGLVIHPAYLDGWLQGLGALLPVANEDGTDGLIFLPVALERLELYKIPSGRVWSCARFVSGSIQEGWFDAQIAVFNESGDRVAQIAGLRLMAAPRDKLMSAMLQPETDGLFAIQWQAQPLKASDADQDMRDACWIILGADNAVGQALSGQFADKGMRCVKVSAGEVFEQRDASHYVINPMQPDDFKHLLDAVAASTEASLQVVHLFALDMGSPDQRTEVQVSQMQQLPCGSALHLAQALAGNGGQQRGRIWLVTRGSRHVDSQSGAVDPFQAPLWGLGGVIAQEHPELRCTRIDLDASAAGNENAAWVFQEITAKQRGEAEIAFRQGVRLIPRLISWQRQSATVVIADQEAPPIALRAPDNGVIDDLAFGPAARRGPSRHEVEIAATAVGLNFRDVLNALKMMPGAETPLGGECAGRVVAVGEGVEDLQVGDKVLAFAPGGFRSHVIVKRAYAHRMPSGMHYTTAASIPVIFLTASYALRWLASLTAGDTILIHAASGGVGLAAVQIAQAAGAEIFATAGSSEKRNYLRSLGIRHVMDSRSVDFSDQIMVETQGRGVTMVLNSLSGEMIPKSLAVVSPGGTFFEIGKRDIWEAGKVAQIRPDITYHVFDLATVADETPEIIVSLFEELMASFATGTLKPACLTVFAKSQVSDAFRTMARAKHIGKIVVRLRDQAPSGRGPGDRKIQKNGTYLITGGLGAIGLETARWLIANGAGHLALAGRHAPGASAKLALAELRQGGAKVAVFQADVANRDDTEVLLDQIGKTMPPLCGIVHAAGVLDDGALMTQSWQRFRTVLAPKLDGAWNLHRLTRNMDLTLFVCFSSAAAIIGWPGQGSYAAANAFLDALALRRWFDGRSGLSINWGPWSDGGMAANLPPERRQRFTRMGLGTLSSAQGLAHLQRLWGSGGQVIVMPVDWERFQRNWPDGINRSLFEAVVVGPLREDTEQQAVMPGDRLKTELEQAPPGNRMKLLMGHLERQAAQVLGLAPGRRIEANRPLKEIGLDSLMAVELRNALNTLLALTLPATLLFDYPSLEDLARYLKKRMPVLAGELAADESYDARPKTLPPSSELANLSDQEAEELLLSELKLLEEKQNG